MNDQLVKSVAEWISVPVAVVIVAPMLAAALWIWMRTGTTSVLLDRFWRLVIGDTLSKDSLIGKAVVKHLTLVEFRFRFFPKARTTEQAEAAIAWAESHSEDIGSVAAVGDYFDIENCQMADRIPGTVSRAGILVWASLLAVALAFFVTLATRTDVLIRVNSTSNYYWVSNERVTTFSNNASLSKAECEAGTGATRLVDGTILCGLLASKADIDNLTKTVPLQSGMFWWISLYLLWVTVLGYRWFLRAMRAHALINRLTRT